MLGLVWKDGWLMNELASLYVGAMRDYVYIPLRKQKLSKRKSWGQDTGSLIPKYMLFILNGTEHTYVFMLTRSTRAW